MSESLDYRQSGVDIDAAESALKKAKGFIQSTHGPRVLGRFGAFSGVFDIEGLGDNPLLVASCDGVGTKLKLAFGAGRHDTVGQDLVNHCVDDILCCGARPLFFLDYLGIGKLTGEVFEGIVQGLAKACRENDMALLGGETAEMPGMYSAGEYDLVGTIVGCVDRARVIDGSRIEPGDALVGLASTGLHTNGYSLAQKALFEVGGYKPEDTPEGLDGSLADELLQIHRSYKNLVFDLATGVDIRGIAHITGGGFEGNIPRVFPEGVGGEIDTSSWPVPKIFELIQSAGNVKRPEMYRVFNMGIGLVLMVPASDVDSVLAGCRDKGVEAFQIGQCTRGEGLRLKL